MWLRLALLLVLGSVFSTPASAICRWKDANGRTQYSDQPPPGVQCEGTVKKPKPVAGAAAPATSQSLQDRDQEFRKRRADKQEAEKKAEQEKEQAEAKRAQCEAARSRLAGLQAGGRVARYNAAGQLEYMDDAQIAKELADVRRATTELCK